MVVNRVLNSVYKGISTYFQVYKWYSVAVQEWYILSVNVEDIVRWFFNMKALKVWTWVDLECYLWIHKTNMFSVLNTFISMYKEIILSDSYQARKIEIIS